jgi:hypothetical protein
MDPSEVYLNPFVFVTANWSGSYGTTGTSASSSNNISCGSDPAAGVSTYSKMPTLVRGILTCAYKSFYANPKWYSLSFEGGTASITDP